MRRLLKIGKWLLALVIFAIAAAAGALYLSPPELICVAAGYSAKIVCSNVFIAGRDPGTVLEVDVQAPGHWILEYILVGRRPPGKDRHGRAARHFRQAYGRGARRFRLHLGPGRQARGCAARFQPS